MSIRDSRSMRLEGLLMQLWPALVISFATFVIAIAITLALGWVWAWLAVACWIPFGIAFFRAHREMCRIYLEPVETNKTSQQTVIR